MLNIKESVSNDIVIWKNVETEIKQDFYLQPQTIHTSNITDFFNNIACSENVHILHFIIMTIDYKYYSS